MPATPIPGTFNAITGGGWNVYKTQGSAPSGIAVPEITGASWDVFRAAGGQGSAFLNVGALSTPGWGIFAGFSASIVTPPTENVNPITGGGWSTLAATAEVGWTQSVNEIAAGSWSTLAAIANVGITEAVPVLDGGSWATFAATGQGGSQSSVNEVTASGFGTFTASAQTGSQSSVPAIGSAGWTVFKAGAQTGFEFAAPAPLNATWGIFSATFQSGSTLGVNELTSPGFGLYAASAETGSTEAVKTLSGGGWSTLSASGQISGSYAVPKVQSGGWTVFPAGVGGPAIVTVAILGTPGWDTPHPIWVPLDGGTIPLEEWQTRAYWHRVTIWRKTRNAAGDPVWRAIIAALPCRMYSSPNVSKPVGGAGPEFKEEGVYLYNRLSYPAMAILEDTDFLQIWTPPGNPDSGDWFVIRGIPKNRAEVGENRSNKGMVYLNPVDDVPAQLVA